MTLSPVEKTRATRLPPCAPGRVLVVIDRPVLLELIKLTLNHGSYTTRAVTTFNDAATALIQWQPHLAILDMDLGGTQILAKLGVYAAAGGMRVLVIGLTRRGDLKNKLAAYEAGADDIMTVPFAPDELLARVTALVGRAYSHAGTFMPVIKLGPLEVDILNRMVRVGNSELHVTSLEQSLLYLLAANAGRVVTREQILDTLWGEDYVAESNVVDRQIRNLRAVLYDHLPKSRLIATVPGRGYRFYPDQSN